MAKKKNSEKEHIDAQRITSDGGYAQGVYYSRQMAIDTHKMISDNIDHLKSTKWANQLDSQSVKLYLESIENKLTQLSRIINFSENKGNTKTK